MAKFVSIFISEGRQRLIACLVFALIFTLAVGALVFAGLARVRENMTVEMKPAMERFADLRRNVVNALRLLDETVTAEPCSADYYRQLHRVAYRPDGLSEIIYAPGGIAQCAVHGRRFDPPISFGQADLVLNAGRTMTIWFDRDLSFMGLDGLVGSLVLRGPFALVVPTHEVTHPFPSWLTVELVAVGPTGRWWHRTGAADVYSDFLAAEPGGWTWARHGALFEKMCDDAGLHCVVARASVLEVLARNRTLAGLGFVFALLLAGWSAERSRAFIRRYWAFEARFRRYLGPDSIVCAYQPIVELGSGRITGCEVLARWRDVDDGIVYPDRFLAILEEHGLTRTFTRLVVERARAELAAVVPEEVKLQVNFNIFPSDLRGSGLIETLSAFRGTEDRFELAVEIVENSAVDPCAVREAIDQLRRAGIKVYVDDFGIGYSTMQGIAALPLDGVKLDRSFAMAPDDSLMARMLGRAIEMVQLTGRAVVIEGVETAERLAQLRAMTSPADYVQGYHLGRPMRIEAFAALVAEHRPAVEESRKVA